MARELLQILDYTHTSKAVQSLLYGQNRERFSRDENGRFEDALELKDQLDLKLIAEKGIGRKRLLRMYEGTVFIHHCDKEDITDIRIGLATESAVKKKDAIQEPKIEKVVVRESRGFHPDDFAEAAERLITFNEGMVPKYLKPGIVNGMLLGAAAGGLIGCQTYDWVSTGTAIISGGAIGFFGGHYSERMEQWELEQQIPNLGEYFANETALERLARLANHVETMNILKQINNSLMNSEIYISRLKMHRIWRSVEMGAIIKAYSDASDQAKRVELIDLMTETFRRNTSAGARNSG